MDCGTGPCAPRCNVISTVWGSLVSEVEFLNFFVGAAESEANLVVVAIDQLHNDPKQRKFLRWIIFPLHPVLC